MKIHHHFSALVFQLLLIVLTGCTSLGLKKPDVWPLNSGDNKPIVPNQVVANWTNTVMYQGSRIPVRGFGGRLLFYADGKKDPVKVDGTLVVYAFDEKNRDPNNAKPDRKFVFTKEQLATHYSKTKMDYHSYSVWLPWDEAGGEQREISLIVRFMPEKGNVLVGELTKQILPGKTENVTGNANAIVATSGNGSIQPVSYESSAMPAYGNVPQMEAGNGASRNMTTTTINLPRSSVLMTPAVWGAGANNGVSNPQARPAAGNNAMPCGQMPSLSPSTAASPSANAFSGFAANSAIGGGMNAMNSAIGPAGYPAVGAGINAMNSSFPQNPNCQPPNRFGPGQSRVPGASISRPTPYRAPWQPYPSAPGFGPGASPGSLTNAGYPASPGVAGSTTY